MALSPPHQLPRYLLFHAKYDKITGSTDRTQMKNKNTQHCLLPDESSCKARISSERSVKYKNNLDLKKVDQHIIQHTQQMGKT